MALLSPRADKGPALEKYNDPESEEEEDDWWSGLEDNEEED